MAETTFEVEGLQELLAGLEMSPQIIKEEAEKATRASLFLFSSFLKDYPPQPATSSYRRTGTLGRTWATAMPSFTMLGNGFEGKIGNATPYASLVQGDGTQARAHEGRWQTDMQAIEASYDATKEHYEAAARRIVARIDPDR